MEIEPMNIIHQICRSINRKLGEDIIVLDLSKITSICDYFIIASASSSRQVKSIVDEVQDKLLEQDIDILRREGYDNGRWVLLDYGDIVIHVFHEEDRKFYNIDGVWKDAIKVNIDTD